MRNKILISVSMILVLSCGWLHADDTPAQAEARAALEQEFHQLDRASAQASPSNAIATHAALAESVVPTAGAAATNVSTALAPPADAGKIPAASSVAHRAATASGDNTAAQAIALAALRERMEKLNNAASQPLPEKKLPSATEVIPLISPTPGASVGATPITETPDAEAPAARTPATAAATVSPASVPPAVMVPASEGFSAPASAAVPSVNVVSNAAPRSLVQRTTGAAAPPEIMGLPKSSPGHARPTNELATVSGKIYKNVEIERVTSDGIVISYTPAFGGWATTQVPFEDLPDSMRRLYEKQ